MKITEILEKQNVIVLWKFRRYYRVIRVEKCLKHFENFIQFLEEFYKNMFNFFCNFLIFSKIIRDFFFSKRNEWFFTKFELGMGFYSIFNEEYNVLLHSWNKSTLAWYTQFKIEILSKHNSCLCSHQTETNLVFSTEQNTNRSYSFPKLHNFKL